MAMRRLRRHGWKLQLYKIWPRLTAEPFPLSKPFAAIFFPHIKAYDDLVRATFRRQGAGAVACVIDGNEKSSPAARAEPMAELKLVPGTKLHYLQDCCRTPMRKQLFCAQHTSAGPPDCGVRIYKKACLAEAPQDLFRSHPSHAVELKWPLPPWVRRQVHLQATQRRLPHNADIDVTQAA